MTVRTGAYCFLIASDIRAVGHIGTSALPEQDQTRIIPPEHIQSIYAHKKPKNDPEILPWGYFNYCISEENNQLQILNICHRYPDATPCYFLLRNYLALAFALMNGIGVVETM